ncbi:MAG TPA: aspartate-semialdehyde dehydrogenase [Candidatus Binatia bacterium]|jgi:aspartate-semialdehyde dehydrogenase|nr:aspartate-semialdehyde dehydrogenase [Candidatus Binatia bacterium]
MATDALTVAVVGASGLAGREILRLIESRAFPAGEVRLLGSVRTAGSRVEEGGIAAPVVLLAPHLFDGVDVAFFAAGPTVSGEFAPVASEAGAAVVDLTSRFRFDELVPLVVPEVNREALADWRERGIVANPSGTTIALSVVLAPLLAEAGLRRVQVSTYQGVAGAGRRAINALSKETIGLLNGRGTKRTRFARRIAFNVLPQVGALEPGGATTHELQAMEETRRVLGIPDLAMQITAVRVPVFFGLGLAVNIETERPISPEEAAAVLLPAPGILLHGTEPDPYPTPIEVTGSEATHVGRIRTDPSTENGLSLWVSLDSIGKGAALNAVQIAEVLVRDHL